MNVSASWWVFASIFWGCAVLLFWFGYLIRVQRRLDLLAGYRPEAVADEDGLARDAGAAAGWIGVATSMVPVAALVVPGAGSILLITVGYLVVVILLALLLAVRSRSYMR